MPRSTLVLSLAAVCAASSLLAQTQQGTAPAARAPLTEADYGRIETLGSSALSPDGKWMAYDYRRGSGGGELRYRPLSSDAEKSVRNGASPVFTSNNRWLLYTITPDTGDGGGRGGRGGGRGGGGAGAGAGAGGGNRSKVGITDLRTGTSIVREDVQSFSVNKTGSHVALRRYPGAGRRSSDLVIRDLDQGTDVTLGNVGEFAWSDDGSTLAMTVDVDGKTGNGVQVLNTATGAIRSLDASDNIYSNLVWRSHSDDLVALRSRADSAFVDTAYTVLTWRGASTARSSMNVYDYTPEGGAAMPLRIASYRRPQWSEDGSIVYLGLAPREARRAPERRTGPPPARVQVWHWKDLRQFHQQQVQAAQDRQRTELGALHVASNKLVRLAGDIADNVVLSGNRLAALATDEEPYVREVMSGRQYRDVYRVDVATGKREKLATKVPTNPSMSPSGRFVMYVQGGHWWVHDTKTGAKTNITAKIKSTFVDMEDDHPVHERRGYGVGGWTTGEKSVLLYDRFDVWQVDADGGNATRLTRGKEDSTVYRYVNVDDEAPVGGGGRGGRGGGGGGSTIDTDKPIMLSATGEYNKKSGYARVTIGQPAQRLLFVDKSVGRLDKADDADVYAYTAQTYEESPTLFVAGPSLADGRQVSHTNGFLKDFAWGKQVLMPYTNKRGDKLQMMLTYPADYQPGKQYPMVVYYYEKLSQGFHQFVAPTDRATYNTTVFSQNGYFVLRPDIVFQPRNPGYSGLDCVTAAVKAALATGMIDPKRVGNMGHSWGGYQSAFYAVHNPGIFAATIAGAPLTDLVSFYGYTSGNSGLGETGHFETGQERMQVSLWEDPQAFIRNSTVFSMDSLKTPLLLEEGDVDGNVNPFQSQEVYNFGRRLGKNVVYLVYEDENHGVARPESQRDYHTRQLEWFAHYLKGEPAADWITNGETYAQRQKLLRDATAPATNAGGGQAVQAGAPGGRGGRPPQ